jgi:hypothetical protein
MTHESKSVIYLLFPETSKASGAPLQLTEEPLDVRSFSHKGTLLRQRASAEPQWHQDMIVKKMIVMTPIVNDT